MVDFAFLDSGTGGIPYLVELKRKCPEAECIYVGDTANFPYGQKSHEQIVACVSKVVAKVIEQFSPKVIVIACNTISVNALEDLRKIFTETEFVGTVPAIKLAAKVSKKKKIGLLATEATCKNPYNIDLKNKFASDCEMILRPDPDLIDFIERKSFSASREERIAACSEMADFFNSSGCDTVILGCTHFLNIKEEIMEACGNVITVVDSCEGVVNHALEVAYGCKEKGKLDGGVTGVSPVRKGGEQRSASQGKTFPSLFITGFNDKNDEKEYDVVCKRYNLRFCGIL